MSATLAQQEELTSRRRYVPPEIWGDELDLNKFEEHECDERWVIAPNEETGRCPCCDQHYFGKTFIITIDGACRGNGGANATAACGVFANIGSELNNAFILHEPKSTSQRAEIHAAINALKSLQTVYETSDRASLLHEVIIQTDSAYLVNSMTSYVNKWRSKGYVSSQKKPVVNQDLLKKPDSLVFALGDNAGLQVRFWHVLRDRSRPADNLANAALDGNDWQSFGVDQLFAGGPKPYVRPCDC